MKTKLEENILLTFSLCNILSDFILLPKMTLNSQKVRNIATLNITWVHSRSKTGLLKEIVLLEVCVRGRGGDLSSTVFSSLLSHAVCIYLTFSGEEGSQDPVRHLDRVDRDMDALQRPSRHEGASQR